MIFRETEFWGVWLVEPERHSDDRGFFARLWCAAEAEARGLCTTFVQTSTSYNHKLGTLRGMHYQVAPYEEIKLVRCTRGGIFDVVVDLRDGSETFLHWFGIELTADNGRALYIPGGFAHGYQTLRDRTEVHYSISEFYTPGAQRGLRWDDPAVGIEWPAVASRTIAEKDRNWPDFRL